MLRKWLTLLITAWLLLGCTDKATNLANVTVEGVDANEQNAIKSVILNGKTPPKEYRELAWKKLKCSDAISQRIGKRAVFIAHRFQEKQIYGGEVTREAIFFIGNDKPSKIIDFDVKTAFSAFLATPSIQEIFAPSIWDLKRLHELFPTSANDASAKETIKDFIYSIKRFAKEDQSYLDQAISMANTPMSIANNTALFIVMRLFPELLEELLFDEITYKGKYY